MNFMRLFKNKKILGLIFAILAFSINFMTISKVPAHAEDFHLLRRKSLVEHVRIHYGCECITFPFMEILGRNIFVFRLLQSISIGLGSLLAFLLFYRISGLKVSIISTLLLTTFPFYIVFYHGFFPFEALLFIASIYFFVKYFDDKKTIDLYILSFIMGFAVGNNLTFILILPALLIATVLVKKNLLKQILQISTRKKIIVLLIFIVGSSVLTVPLFNLAAKKDFSYQGFSPSVKIFHRNRNIRDIFAVNRLSPNIISDNALNIYRIIIFLSLVGWLFGFKGRRNSWHYFLLVFFFTYFFIFDFFPWPHSKTKTVFRLLGPFMLFPFLLISGISKITSDLDFKNILIISFAVILLGVNITGVYRSNNFLSDEKEVELMNPRISAIHTRPSKYIESGSKVYGVYWLLKGAAVRSSSEFKCFDHGISERLNSIKKVLKKEKVFLILPVRNWSSTNASKILYYCSSSSKNHGKINCNHIRERVLRFSEENNIILNEAGKVRSHHGFSVYVVYELKRDKTKF